MKPRHGIRNLIKHAAESAVKPTSVDSAEEAWIYVRMCRIQRATHVRFNSQGDMYVPDSEDEEDALEVAANGAVGVELASVVAADRAAGVDPAPAMAVDGATDVDPAPAEDADGASGVDPAPTVAADGAAGVDLAPAVATDGAASVDLAPVVAADGAAVAEMKPEVATRLAKKVLGEDPHPEVAALLAEVLSKMEPLYHECFIGMYKIMVPIFFTPAP
jgi:hypothetical protein